MAKTKKKHKKGKKVQADMKSITVTEPDVFGPLLFTKAQINDMVVKAATAAQMEVMRYASRYKSANSQRPVFRLADKVFLAVQESCEAYTGHIPAGKEITDKA